MKVLSLIILGFLFISLPVFAKSREEKKDPIAQGLRDAFNSYKRDDLEMLAAELKVVLKLLNDRKAALVGAVLPNEVENWKAGELKTEELTALGGGIAVTRTYTFKAKSITAKVIKDSPTIDKWLKVLSNRDALKFTGKKVHTIDGEAALVESERKILIGIEGEVLLQLEGDNDCEAKDILTLARKLDLKKMKKLK